MLVGHLPAAEVGNVRLYALGLRVATAPESSVAEKVNAKPWCISVLTARAAKGQAPLLVTGSAAMTSCRIYLNGPLSILKMRQNPSARENP